MFFRKREDCYYVNNNKQIKKSSLKKIGMGGEGEIYETADEKIIKIYTDNSRKELLEKKIIRMIDKNIDCPGICWPKDVVYDNNNNFVGFTMKKASGKPLSVTILKPIILKKNYEKWTRINLVNIVLNILKKIQFLHQNNILIGDLNDTNILIDEEENIFFVDVDSYQIEEFRCEFGKANFTAAEIQGKDFKNFHRTIEHEKFAIATLLFMILLPGQKPYSHIGGGDEIQNIIENNFPYPYADNGKFLVPKGSYEFIWNAMPFEVKREFYNTFSLGKRTSVAQWINVMELYKRMLKDGEYKVDIFPGVKSRVEDKITRSLNKLSDGLGEMETVLNPNFRYNPKIAVIELSTKNIKALIGDVDSLKRGFDFKYFKRESREKNVGKKVNHEDILDVDYVKKDIVNELKEFEKYLKLNDVDIVYSVATAGIRTTSNREEILAIINENTGLNVKVLSKDEEATATINGYIYGNNLEDINDSNYIIIDQGGGSVEITFYNLEEKNNYTFSLDLGSLTMENRMFTENNIDTKTKTALNNLDKLTKDILSDEVFYCGMENSGYKCVGVGTAITTATGKNGNKNQNGMFLSTKYIDDKIAECERYLVNNYPTVEELNIAIKKERDEKLSYMTVEKKFIMRIGLRMFKEILDYYGIDGVTVNGAGLWYGIYSEKYKEIYG